MNLKLMYITNEPETAKAAQEAGIDRVFIDLELNGKYERQGHLDTHITTHKIDDINKVRKVLDKSDLLVRVNPIYKSTKDEINRVIEYGADVIMLPMFKNDREVERFINLVNGRAKTCLLLETAQALVRIDDILEIDGIDEIHIGLNDLHISMGLDSMFELLSGGILDYLSEKIKKKGICFGFGGIAKIGTGVIPANMILAEHYRLKSESVILSRAFRNNLNDVSVQGTILKNEIEKIRNKEYEYKKWTKDDFEINRIELKKIIKQLNYTLT
ncbi:aldolase [Bacillus sp. SD075]|uniref:aldolase/citrate lyase family protein n=1 Tax=Bacillus sp. SD075 TaxID=2781732 RepID=UPI001A95CEEE|nr:aldolase/citrate lyase family protein [Bacillus sp. SD075]MBO0996437.1 aldolase [Bacillus sp. SD075]